MDADTARNVESVRRKRWYSRSLTMGVGGWPEVYKFAAHWKTYLLQFPGEEESAEIVAESDAAAVAGFRELFDVTRCTLIEKTVTYRKVPLS